MNVFKKLSCDDCGPLGIDPIRSCPEPGFKGGHPVLIVFKSDRDAALFLVRKVSSRQYLSRAFNGLPPWPQPTIQRFRWFRTRCEIRPPDPNQRLDLSFATFFVLLGAVATSYRNKWMCRPLIQPKEL